MSDHDLPPEVLAIFKRLWPMETPLAFALRPRDAWVVLGIVQFASRNPALLPAQQRMIESFGRGLQAGIVQIAPDAAPYLEMGWDAAHDVPRSPPAPSYRIYQAASGQTVIQCLRCDATSAHPDDIAQRYCGRCKVFLEDHSQIERDVRE